MAEPMQVHPVISQEELTTFCDLREQFKSLERHLRESLDKGAEVEEGVHSARLFKVSSKRPNWKAFILRKHGKGTVSRIMSATRPIYYFRMEIK